MTPERLHGEISLGPTQQQAAKRILEVVTPRVPQVVVVEGLSGVGKTTLLSHLQAEIAARGGTIVDPEKFIRGKVLVHGPVVTTATLGDEQNKLAEALGQSHPDRVTTIPLPAMGKKEMVDLLSHYPMAAGVSKDRVASYLMGIPLLAERFGAIAGSESVAVALAADYLHHVVIETRLFRQSDLQAYLQPYLQMPITSGVLAALEEQLSLFTQEKIYAHINMVMQNREKYQAHGIDTENPLFVDPASEAMYDRMLTLRTDRHIEIFVPDVNYAALQRVKKLYGFSFYGYQFGDAVQIRMFAALDRKEAHGYKEGGDEWICSLSHSQEAEEFGDRARAYEVLFSEGKLGLLVGQGERNTFFLSATEHPGSHPNPILVAWGAESLFQRMGITYFVNNRILGGCYTYDPKQQKISVPGPYLEEIGDCESEQLDIRINHRRRPRRSR